MFIVLGFRKGNKWLAHNGLWAKVDPPADNVNIRQKGWLAGADLEAIAMQWYDESKVPVIVNNSLEIKVSDIFENDYILEVSNLNKSGLKSVSWHRYDEGLFLLLIYPDEIYLTGHDPQAVDDSDDCKLKYKLIRGFRLEL